MTSSTQPRRYSSQRIHGFQETVFAKYTQLSRETGAINLGQGFPDFEPEPFVFEALKNASRDYQQYAPLAGMPGLLESIAQTMQPRLRPSLEPFANVQITVGATEALYVCMQAFVEAGDEVILLEPFYDAYPADVQMAGGMAKYVPLHPQADGRWLLDEVELRAAFSNNTKAIVLNTPHNPTGKVFTAQELRMIVDLATEFDTIIITDEVYEHIAFEPHISIASLDGAWERTLTISSIGKTYSVTGWKIGWVVGAEPLIHALRMAHQWIPFAVATPLQVASAQILRESHQPENTFLLDLRMLYQQKRDMLASALSQTAFRPLNSDGTYFVMVDSSALDFANDVELCLALPEQAGVGAIPPSAFYSEPHKHLAKNLVRFAFCKTDDALAEAGERLKQWSNH